MKQRAEAIRQGMRNIGLMVQGNEAIADTIARDVYYTYSDSITFDMLCYNSQFHLNVPPHTYPVSIVTQKRKSMFTMSWLMSEIYDALN